MEGQQLPPGHESFFGKFVLEEQFVKQEKDHPDRVIFIEYGFTDLAEILSRCKEIKENNPELDPAKVDRLMAKVKLEMKHRMLELIDKA